MRTFRAKLRNAAHPCPRKARGLSQRYGRALLDLQHGAGEIRFFWSVDAHLVG